VPSSLGDPSSTSSTESTSSSSLVKSCQPDTISLNTMLKQWFSDNSSPASAPNSFIVPSPSLASSPQAAADAAVVGSGDIVGSDDLAQAEALVSKLGKLHGVVPDATTVNSLIQIACQPRSTKSTGNLGSHLHHEFHWAPHASGLMGRAEAYVRLLERAHDGAWLARDDAENGGCLEELTDIEGGHDGNDGDVSLLEDRRGGGESVGATVDFCLLFEESSPSFSCNEISDNGGNEGGSSSSSVDDPRSKRMKLTRLTRQGRKWWREVQFSLEESLLSPEKKAPRSFSRHHSSPAAQQQKSQRSHKQKQLKKKKKKKKKTEQQGEGQQQHKQLAVAYTSLLVGYARSGDLKRAVDVFARRMPSRGGCCCLGIMIDLLKISIEGWGDSVGVIQ
jgi:pentatricopeptide repeat protein